jgi:hypothetical protein
MAAINGVANAVLPRKLRESFGLGNVHNRIYRTMNYSTENGDSRTKFREEAATTDR